MNKPLPPRYAKLTLCMGLAFSGPLMAEQAASQADFLALQQAFNDFKSQTEQDLEQQQGTLGDIAVRMQAFEDKLSQLAADIAADQSAQAPVTDIQSISVPSTEYPSSPQLQHGCQTALKGTPINTLQDALACLNTVQIAPTGEVHLTMVQQPADGVLYDTIYVQHPNGDRIFIEGDCAGADRRCTLNFNPSAKRGFELDHNAKLASISGFNLRSTQVGTNSTVGIRIAYGSGINMVHHVDFSNFDYGFLVERDSYASVSHINAVDNHLFDIRAAWDAHLVVYHSNAAKISSERGGNFEIFDHSLIGKAESSKLSQIQCYHGSYIEDPQLSDASMILDCPRRSI